MLEGLKSRILGSFNYTLKVKGPAGSFRLPVINNVGRAHLDEHDPHIDVVLKRFYKPGCLLIDVGVNIGQTLVKFAKIAGKRGRYIGFEPNPKAASYVDDLIIRNDLENALVLPVGLGSSTDLVPLFMASVGSTDPGASVNQAIRDSDFYGTQKLTAIFRGDEALRKFELGSDLVIVKIDAEGGELEVLEGLEVTIQRQRPIIILEILPASQFSSAVNEYRFNHAKNVRSHMAKINYIEYAISADGALMRGGSSTSDYLFLPTERSSLLLGV